MSGDFRKGWEAYDKADYATALSEWKSLAKQGNAAAQTSLAFLYDYGQGVPQNYKTAVKWYTLAAEQGDSTAQYNLGFMHAEGHGVIQDSVLAHMWWNIAASQGNEDAQKNRDSITEQMSPPQLEKSQSLARQYILKMQKQLSGTP